MVFFVVFSRCLCSHSTAHIEEEQNEEVAARLSCSSSWMKLGGGHRAMCLLQAAEGHTTTTTSVKPFQTWLCHTINIASLGAACYSSASECIFVRENSRKFKYMGISVKTHLGPWDFCHFYPVMDICGMCTHMQRNTGTLCSSVGLFKVEERPGLSISQNKENKMQTSHV